MICPRCFALGYHWHGEPCISQMAQADRIAGALLALSRVAIWMAMEADAQQSCLDAGGFSTLGTDRELALSYAIRSGRLRLTWCEP